MLAFEEQRKMHFKTTITFSFLLFFNSVTAFGQIDTFNNVHSEEIPIQPLVHDAPHNFVTLNTITSEPTRNNPPTTPTFLFVFRGIGIGGGLEDIQESDDNYATYREGLVLGVPPALWLIFESTLPTLDRPN